MASKADICNLALSNIGISQFVANIDTDRTNEAIVCRRWFPVASEMAQRDFDWNFNSSYVDLAALSGTVPGGFLYMYAYPADCLLIRDLITPGVRFPRNDQRVVYRVANVGDVKVILTDEQLAGMRYSFLVNDTGLFDAHFVPALAALISSFIAMPLAVSQALADKARISYQQLIYNAAARNANEQQQGPEPDSESVALRMGG